MYFTPSNPRDIARAVGEVLSSRAQQNRLVGYGLERVKDFYYSNIAMRYEELYRELLGLGVK